MLVKSPHVENLLSFDTFDLDLDGKTCTIVGPNGAGESNIVRVFDLVNKAVDWASDLTLSRFPCLCLRAGPPDRRALLLLYTTGWHAADHEYRHRSPGHLQRRGG